MGLKFMKTGAAAQQEIAKNAAQIEAKKAEMGKAFRFFTAKGNITTITFVDGDLDDNGILDLPMFYEHNLYMNGKWGNHYVCPEKTMPGTGKCPICEGGDTPYLAAVATIIDHTPYTTNNGAVIPYTRKLFVAKPITMEILSIKAKALGGLAGKTFMVSRVGENAPAVGNMFELAPPAQQRSIEAWKADPALTRKVKLPNSQQETTIHLFNPLDYEHECTFRNRDELLALGFGGDATTKVHHHMAPQAASGNVPTQDYSGQL